MDGAGSQLYADRCTLLLRREPLMTSCNGNCEKFATIPKCNARTLCPTSQTLHGSCDGVIMHPYSAAVTSQLLNDETETQLIESRDKSLDYKWDSLSVHDTQPNSDVTNESVDVNTTAATKPEVDAIPHDVDAITTLVQVPVEPYYFKYGHARTPRGRVHFRQAVSSDDLAPDVLSNCSTFKCASLNAGALQKST